MASYDLPALGDKLVQERLIHQDELNQSLLQLGSKASTAEDLLGNLESRNLLTSWQVSRIKKNEWDELVLGDYKLMYQNASGSFARVFRGGSLFDGHMVGIKVLRQRWAAERRHVDDFHREAQLGMTLQHENIVPIYDHGIHHGTKGDVHYLVMEFVEGGNLRDFIQIRKKLSPSETMRFTLDIAKGLRHALAMGFTHRDLKLTNVLMSSKGVAKLVDFGLAGTDSVSHHQRAVEYATLEKATNAPANDPRSDLFFLGVIVYELLCGEPAYQRTNDINLRKQVSRYQNIRPIGQIEPNTPSEVQRIVDRLISFHPEGRYQSVDELIGDLHDVLPGLEEEEKGTTLEGTSFKPGAGSSAAANSKLQEDLLPTVLCVEHRTKQQNILREYLSKRGFRPLMVGDVERALNRLQSKPPDCVVLFGESIEDDLPRAFQVAAATSAKQRLAVVAVLSKDQNKDKGKLKKTGQNRVLLSPITLRDLRKEIHLALQHVPQETGNLNSVVT
jgi:serine/threonine protein kinase